MKLRLKIIKPIIFGLGLSLLTSCATSSNTSVTVHKTALDDEEYVEILEDKTRDVHVYDVFKSQYKITVTLLDESFMQALSKRISSVLLKEQIKELHIENKTAFFVVLSTPDRKMEQLEDKKIWTVTLKDGAETLKASEIKYMREKSQSQLFFPSVDTWSKEFLVIFDKDPKKLSQDISLVVTNGKAEVKLGWP